MASTKPQVTDPELVEAIDEFIKQEAWHAQAHDTVLRHLEDLGIDPSGYIGRLERFFCEIGRPGPRGPVVGSSIGVWPSPLRSSTSRPCWATGR